MAEDESRTNTAGRNIDREGRYEQKITTEDVLGLFDEIEGPVLVAGDIADRFDVSPETGRRRLRTLLVDGKVAKREARKRVPWWRTDDTDAGAGSIADVLADNDPETVLRLLSYQVDDPITLGDTVYENGDTHPLGEN